MNIVRKLVKWGVISLVSVLVLILIGAIVGLSNINEENAEAGAKSAPKTVTTATAPKSIEAAAKSVFGDDFKSVINVGGVEEITVNLASNLTQNLTLKATYLHAVELGAAVKSNSLLGDSDGFLLVFTTELTDNLGNVSVDPVVKIKFTQDTLDKINFANVSHDSVPTIADSYWQHAVFNK